MAATTMDGIFTNDSLQSLGEKKVLVVGAGGIGCELLKNLVLSGFKNIDIIDLDTIELSNLNRQFLFQRQHVGRPKAVVAKETVQRFNPDAIITAYHDSITNPEYGVDYFKQFDLVMNALDNRPARNHVNRMCLASDIPLVESGSAGYLGQVDVIKKGHTECYECRPKPPMKTYAGCTIRNTPSEPIHCIVWAKHLFNQLFGAADADDEVSPDTEDPEAGGAKDPSLGTTTTTTTDPDDPNNKGSDDITGGIHRTSTKEWAMGTGYDPEKIIKKLFHDDINYLLSMDNLWKSRTPPKPLDISTPSSEKGDADRSTSIIITDDSSTDESSKDSASISTLPDQSVWSIKQCLDKFRSSISELKTELKNHGPGAELSWDKDNAACMDFTTSSANVRCSIFKIPQKSKFDVKSMAGNIIPAIATTNAIIAGLIVMEAFKILTGNFQKCQTTYLSRRPNSKKMLLARGKLVPPNPSCYVCSLKPEVNVSLDINLTTVKIFEEKVLKDILNMVAPDVEIDDGKGTIIISSEEGETEDNNDKPLCDFNIRNGTRLKADDFLQNYNLVINIQHLDRGGVDRENETLFEVTGERFQPKPLDGVQSNGNMMENAQPSTSQQHEAGIDEIADDDDDDDIEVIDEEEPMEVTGSAGMREGEEEEVAETPLSTSRRKRKADTVSITAKKRKISEVDENDSAMTDPSTAEDNVTIIS